MAACFLSSFVLSVLKKGERGEHGPPGKGERGEAGPLGPKVSARFAYRWGSGGRGQVGTMSPTSWTFAATWSLAGRSGAPLRERGCVQVIKHSGMLSLCSREPPSVYVWPGPAQQVASAPV